MGKVSLAVEEYLQSKKGLPPAKVSSAIPHVLKVTISSQQCPLFWCSHVSVALCVPYMLWNMQREMGPFLTDCILLSKWRDNASHVKMPFGKTRALASLVKKLLVRLIFKKKKHFDRAFQNGFWNRLQLSVDTGTPQCRYHASYSSLTYICTWL